jgi:hypothetical protein
MVRVIFIVVGVVLLAAGAKVGLSVRRFTHVATSADGVVDHLNAGGSHPQVTFVTTAGKSVSYPQGGFVFGARPGDKVSVLYLPDDPVSTARINTFGSLWFGSLLLFALGVGILACGASMKATAGQAGIKSVGGR